MVSVHGIANPSVLRAPIQCHVDDSERSLLSREAGKIAKFIRGLLFFPLKTLKPYEGSPWQQFWETSIPDLMYPRKKEIQATFNRYHQSIDINLEGKKIQLNFTIMETKDCGKDEDVLNHFLVRGNISTKTTDFSGVYPFLDAYVKQKQADPSLPPARFIVFNAYDHTVTRGQGNKQELFLPTNMDQWGLISKKAIESFTQEYGKFQLIAAHSLGNMPTVAHLKHVKDHEFGALFPDTLLLAKGPSSLWEVSKNVPFEWECYPWGHWLFVGIVLYFLSKCVGWTLELDETLIKRLTSLPQTEAIKKQLKNTTIVATAVKKDHYFPGNVALPASKKLDKLENCVNLYRLTFDIPPTVTPPKGQHNFNPGFLQKIYAIQEKLHFQGETILDHDSGKKILESKIDHPLMLKTGESLIDRVLCTSWESTLKNRVAKLQAKAS